jgi:MoaA/NifB/PqqE/SkfB family radical SAM enzyme
MFNFNSLESIEVELSNRCQASCPMCSRNFHGGIENNLFKQTDWTLEEFKNIFNVETLRQLKVINFCGGLGDPLMVKDFNQITNYILNNSPNINLFIHTNGSLRNVNFWKQLPKYLPKMHTVFFGIDGFRDTHSLYRIGTDYDKIIENARAFIDNGGRAVARFIVFKHNEHQYNDLRNFLINDVGFFDVFKTTTKRFKNGDKFPVVDKLGNIQYNLEKSSFNEFGVNDDKMGEIIQFIKKEEINIAQNCESLNIKNLYIDADKNLFPCCYTATNRYELEKINESNWNNILPNLRTEINDIVFELEKLNLISLKNNSIKIIVNDNRYQRMWQQYWDNKKLMICLLSCGISGTTPLI